MKTPCKDTAIGLLTLTQKAEVQQQLRLYTDYLCHLLHGHVHHVTLTQPKAADAYFFAQHTPDKGYDLLVFGEPDRSLVKRLLVRYDKPRFVDKLTASLLVAREPRYPLQKILLIIRAEESDKTAVNWACCLAANQDFQVTCLPVIPAQPGLYRYGAPMQSHHNVLLTEGTRTGKYINRALRQLTQENVTCQLNLQQGEPHNQIKQVLEDDVYDLVILAAEPYGRVQRLLLGELVTPLLHWLDRPILITKPMETT